MSMLEQLQSLVRKKVDLENRDVGLSYYGDIYELVSVWQNPPDLREIFRPEEIDRFLTDMLNFYRLLLDWQPRESRTRSYVTRMRFIYGPREPTLKTIVSFVARSGLKDEPSLDRDGRPVTRRTTALHHAVRCIPRFVRFLLHDGIISDLFTIYDKFHVNYVDEFGLTHLHAACRLGRVDIVKKFLELGADLNCVEWRTGFSTLHYALQSDWVKERRDVFNLLLQSGTNPNVADAEGRTPLHVICESKDDWFMAKMVIGLCDEKHRPLQIDALDKWNNTPLNLALKAKHEHVAQLLLKNGADPNLTDFPEEIIDWKERLPNLRDVFTRQEMDWLLVTSIELHDLNEEIDLIDFVIRCGYKDEPDLDEDGKPLLRRTTPVHQIGRCNNDNNWKIAALKNLFKIYDKFHANYTNESGYTHFHVACQYGLDDVAEKFLELGQDPNCLVAETGNSTLHVALEYSQTAVIGPLLRSGADLNLRNRYGSTPLHVICNRCVDYMYLAEMLFKFCDDKRLPVKIDARNNMGDTPLHLAVSHHSSKRSLVELLLRRGANPNLVNDTGETPLHIIGWSDERGYLLLLFFKTCKLKRQPVQLDIQDNEGNTPLHVATSHGNAEVVKLMLRLGADPNSVNAKGLTPLHIIAKLGRGVEPFFSAIGDTQQTVQIDARDNEGRTALEWAVASCYPPAVVSLLERGADVSGFVFPTASDSDMYWGIGTRLRDCKRDPDLGSFVESPLVVATGLLAIVELLETKVGHELDLDDALKVMGFFDKYKLYQSADSSTTKDVDDLVDSIFKEMANQSTYMDYFKFASSYGMPHHIPDDSVEACSSRLCEEVTRKYFRDWALECFMALIHYRLPTLCCELILKNLKNKDLYNICSAAKGQIDEQDKINVINVIKRKNERPVRAGKAPKG
ncbi:unnamed protein product [Trichogramma brassicae]|uniref:Uncharacterized protein n=1 Tax=Trichogramma brassicae TaxID=86971 RepID=A0A6H5I5I9_9HYME|nr:unnamed protein product [Trichogramma brassicae]